MRLRTGIAVLVVALAGCGSSTAASTPTTSAPSGGGNAACAPARARVLASDRHASIYRLGGAVYGCLSGHTYRLGGTRSCVNSDRVGPVALKGTIAAYGSQRCGVDTGTAQVVVRRLTDGNVIHTEPATSRVPGAESYQSVGSLVVKADGAVGWVGAAHSIIGRGELVEVHRFDRGGHAQLDQGAGIKLRSLRLRGSRISWLHSGRERSATLS